MGIKRLILTPTKRRQLQRQVCSRSMRAEDSRRARANLEWAGGLGLLGMAAYLACCSWHVQRWAGRLSAQRLDGLVTRHRGRKIAKDAAKLEARILEWTQRGLDDGCTHWRTGRRSRPFSAWMRQAPFMRWIISIGFCRFTLAVRSRMALNNFATAAISFRACLKIARGAVVRGFGYG